ncbi:MAG: hypothetical protein ACRD0Z_03790 [Acidimicrobiales bacterium]
MVTATTDEPVVVPDDSSRHWGPQTTFNDAIAGWKANGWEDLSPLTSARYESVWRLHIEQGIGYRKIAATGPYDVARYFRQLKQAGVGKERVRYVRSVLHRACRLARKWSGNSLPNPVADTELPTWAPSDQPGPVRAPSLEEVLAVLEAAEKLDIRYLAGLRVVASYDSSYGDEVEGSGGWELWPKGAKPIPGAAPYTFNWIKQSAAFATAGP